MLRRDFPAIHHQFDVWHFAKSVTKKLHKVAEKKMFHRLRQWIPAIQNDLWWSAGTCGGNPVLLREKWTSVTHHVVNRHAWAGNELFHSCAHDEDLLGQDIDWLPEDGPDIDALHKVVFDRKLPDGKLSEFFHTGSLEVYHSSQLRWVLKRVSFLYLGMRARTQVAALHHNSNVGREQATTRDGRRQWKIVFPKGKKEMGGQEET